MDNLSDKRHNVVAMSDYHSDTGYAAIAQVEAYWEAVRGARLVPKRSDIDPRGIERALENAFILERVTVGIARLRIAGTHLSDIMGMEVRGMPLTSFFTPAARPIVAEQLEIVFQTPAMCTFNLTSMESIGRPPLEARLILLPLKSDLGDVSRVLGCLVTKGDIGAAPRRFDVASKSVLQIVAGETPHQSLERSLSAEDTKHLQDGMAEEQAAFDAAPTKHHPPYLRLVKSEED